MALKKRRSLQFSLRSLLVILTCVAIWFGWHNSRSRTQRIAVKELEASGVQVLYDYQVGESASEIRELPYPTWVVNLLGVDFFSTAVSVKGHGVQAAGLNDSLSALRRLPKVKSVHFGGSRLGNAGIEHIAKLSSLERLGLEYTAVTAEGLAALQNARGLKKLYLKGLPLKDEGLKHISTIESLEFVELNGSEVSERGVQELSASLPNCKVEWDSSYR